MAGGQTRENEVLERLDAHSAAARVDKQDVGGLEGGLAGGCPEPQLAIVLFLLVRWPVEDGRRLGHDLGHAALSVRLLWEDATKKGVLRSSP